jgi:predicted HNH restriction endonuclease
MLKVGFVEVLQAGNGWFHQLVKKDLVPTKLRSDRRISFNYQSYKNAPGCITCDFKVSTIAPVYNALLPAHEAAIRIAARSPRHTTTKRDHSPNFIVFLSEQLGETLPQPAYYDGPLDSAGKDGASVERLVNLYPKVSAESLEGKKIWKEQQLLERNKGLTRAVKTANREANGGWLVCEACALSNERGGLFDAHHLNPLACGIRQSRIDDFAILCPTCHRWAHLFGPDKLQPLSIAELRHVRAGDGR